jgi:hypothetical protein
MGVIELRVVQEHGNDRSQSTIVLTHIDFSP